MIIKDKMSQVDTLDDSRPAVECRACLQLINEDSNFFNIFDGWSPPWRGMESTIAEDLAKIANIQISENDKFSHKICETCRQLLLSACSFTDTVRRNDEILREKYGENKNDFKSDSDKIWPKPIQVDKSLTLRNSMDIDIKQEVLSDEEYSMTNGFYESNRESEPSLDIVKIEPEEMIQPLQIKVTVNGTIREDTDLLKTDQCGTQLTNGYCDNDDQHTASVVKSEPASDDADSAVKSEPGSEDEVDPIVHDVPLECMLCAKKFNSVTGLKAHVIANHSYKTVKRKSSTSSNLSPEKKKRKYSCTVCRRRFTTSTDLMVHETCHNVSKCVCYGCNESFDTFAQLAKHRRKCKVIVNKEVTKVRTLDDVIRTPSKEPLQELKCLYCEEIFTDMYYMKIHQEIHHYDECATAQKPVKKKS